MANIASVAVKIVASEAKDLKPILDYLKRGGLYKTFSHEKLSDLSAMCYMSCKGSFSSAFGKMTPSIEDFSKNAKIEVFGESVDMEFQEHYLFEEGALQIEEKAAWVCFCSDDIECMIEDDDYDETFSQLNEEFKCNITLKNWKSFFKDDDRLEFGGLLGQETGSWKFTI